MSVIERRVFSSEKNGEIVCTRTEGVWSVWVGHYEQSSPYIARMWADAFRRIPNSALIRRVLLLGLGSGVAIRPLHQWFPACTVDAVEWDPVMAGLALTLDAFPLEWKPQVFVEDAAKLLPTLTGPYDLIVCDLFRGSRPASVLSTADMPKEIARLLGPHGCFLLNVFKRPSLLKRFDTALERISTWPFAYNSLAAYITRPEVSL